MSAEVIPIITRQKPRFGLEFDCVGCDHHVYAAVHFGSVRMCFMCQRLGVEEHKKLLAWQAEQHGD